MTISNAMQLEIVNNELATLLLGLVARVKAVKRDLEDCEHAHIRAAAMLTTFQAEELLQRVSPVAAEILGFKAIRNFADAETQAEYVAARLSGESVCSNPSCVDGLAPRKTGPDDDDVDMEPCPVCGGK